MLRQMLDALFMAPENALLSIELPFFRESGNTSSCVLAAQLSAMRSSLLANSDRLPM